MEIITALCLLKEGKKMRRKGWSNKDAYYVLDKDGWIVNENGDTNEWLVIDNLIDGDDWEIYEG
jgi:hypothetical protein